MPNLEWEVEPAPTPVPFEPVAPAGPVEPLLTFRDALRAKSPPWLQRGLAEKLLYSLGVHLDGFTDALTAGVKLRFPGLYSGESLPFIGRDRRIRRGRTESDATYAARLLRWLDDHKRRGGPYALLSQLWAHYAPNNFPISVVYRSGRRFSLDVDGTITRDDISWEIDGAPEKWARWWLIYSWPDAIPTVATYGDGSTWGGRIWGSGLSAVEVTDLRLVPKEWNAAHPIGRIVLLGPGARLWGFPPRAWGSGTWGSSSKTELSVE